MVSIGAVLPFLEVLVDSQQVFDSGITAPFIEMIGINQPSELILPLTTIFAIATVISGFLRIIL